MQPKINTTQIYINNRINKNIYLYNWILYSNKNSMNYYHIHIKNTKKIHNAVQIILFNFKTRQNTIMVIRGQKSGYL